MIARLLFAAVVLCLLGNRPDGSALRGRAVPRPAASRAAAAGATLAPAAIGSERLAR